MKHRRLRLALAAAIFLLTPPYSAAEWGDIVFTRKSGTGGDEYPPATFPHYLHRMQFKCHVCHEAIFHMKAGADEITMDAISGGKFCGACHDNKTAFGVSFEACLRCHR